MCGVFEIGDVVGEFFPKGGVEICVREKGHFNIYALSGVSSEYICEISILSYNRWRRGIYRKRVGFTFRSSL